MNRTFFSFIFVLCSCVLFVKTSYADTMLYTFESPNFTLGQATPLTDVSPNVGNPAFKTTFLNGGSILNGSPYPPLISQALFADGALTLEFNTPVTHLSVGFSLPVPRHSSFLRIVTPADTFDYNSTFGTGVVQGGTMDFTPSVAFTTATLYGFRQFFESDPFSPSEFAIDNLAVTTPEPSSLLLLALGLPALFAVQRLRAKWGAISPTPR